jgi:uncharacterized membrane protein
MSSATGRRVLGVMGVILGTILLVVVALFVYLRIREGRGAEAFQNGYGQYETWTSYAGFLIGALSILLGMCIVGWVQLWRRSRQEDISIEKLIEELRRDT